jgi:large subunit ribosomal protein L3
LKKAPRKRHGFGGFPKTHGHPSIRVPGSIGPGTDPSRVIKGRKMSGHMGTERKTVRNLSVVKVDPERNLIFIRGGIPGARNGWVFVRKQ